MSEESPHAPVTEVEPISPGSIKIVLRGLLFLVLCPLVLAFIAPVVKGADPLTGMLEAGVITSVLTFLLTVLFVRWDRLHLRDVGTAVTSLGSGPWRIAPDCAERRERKELW